MRKIAGLALKMILFLELSSILCSILLLTEGAVLKGLSNVMGRERFVLGGIGFAAILMNLVIAMLIVKRLFVYFEALPNKQKRKEKPKVQTPSLISGET
jgi:hypothetical protein